MNDFPVNTDFISTFKKSSNGVSYKMGKLTNETWVVIKPGFSNVEFQ